MGWGKVNKGVGKEVKKGKARREIASGAER